MTNERIVLTAGKAQATLYPKRGGLLAQLQLAATDGTRQVLWGADDLDLTASTWPLAGCPIMFPFAGRVWHQGELGKYKLGDTVRPMDLHGFAYQYAWQVEGLATDSCTLKLEDSTATHAQFPFHFSLKTSYQLSTNKLTLTIEAKHRGSVSSSPSMLMPLAIGIHPFFRVGADWQTYTFSADARRRLAVTKDGNAASTHQARQPNTLDPMTSVELRSTILSEIRTPQCKLLDAGGKGIQLSWSPAELINNIVLWSSPERGYFCMEPWMGLPDAPHRSETKKIAAGDTLRLQFEIQLV